LNSDPTGRAIPSVSVVNRLTALLLSAGAIAVMLVALSWKVFELDRYFVPKELVLNTVALAAGFNLLIRRRTLELDSADMLLMLFIGWSAVSALFASNHWVAQRALGLSVSSALVFWTARRLGVAGMSRILLGAASLAAVVVAITSLAQAYGVESDWFTLARSPGGTLGNRNFVAHVVAIGLPTTIWFTIAARRPVYAVVGSIAIAVLSATLVLSRSRGAWLAVIVFLIVGSLLLLASRRYWKSSPAGGRLVRVLLAGAIGVGLAVVLPNELDWNSDSPYLDSARKVVDYSSGSGKGRLGQYENSLQMALAHPVFGVGPGNWAVQYPRFADRRDKSLAESGMTANPWPSSDWVAFVSERGIVPALALLGVFFIVFVGAMKRWRELAPDEVLMKIAVAGTIASTMVVSAFDAVLLLAAPAFLVWLIIGASIGVRKRTRRLELSAKWWTVAASMVVFTGAASVVRSATQTKAMTAVGRGGNTAAWVAGSRWDPGSYRIHQRIADIYSARGQCAKARPYVRRSLGLFPTSPPARRVARRCGVKV